MDAEEPGVESGRAYGDEEYDLDVTGGNSCAMGCRIDWIRNSCIDSLMLVDDTDGCIGGDFKIVELGHEIFVEVVAVDPSTTVTSDSPICPLSAEPGRGVEPLSIGWPATT